MPLSKFYKDMTLNPLTSNLVSNGSNRTTCKPGSCLFWICSRCGVIVLANADTVGKCF